MSKEKKKFDFEKIKLDEEKLTNLYQRAKNIKFLSQEASIYKEKLNLVFELPKRIRKMLEKGEVTDREYDLLTKTYESIREYEKILREDLPKYLQCLMSIVNDSLGIYSELTNETLVTEKAKLLFERVFLRIRGVREKKSVVEVPVEKEIPIIKMKKFSMAAVKPEQKTPEKTRRFKFSREFALVPYYMLSNSLFGSIYDSYTDSFTQFENTLKKADIKILTRTYVSVMFFTAWLSYVIVVILHLLIRPIFPNPMFYTLYYLIPIITFLIFYLYPSYRAKERERSINTNLPFAINYMSAIAASGLSPYHLFRIMYESKEYGEIRREMGRIVGISDELGLDVVSSLKNVASTTPSENLSKFLLGISSTIETGGDLRKFLEVESEKALFEYEIRRKKYHELLSTYADIYAAVAVAAPLFLIATLTLLNALGGTIMGFSIQSLLFLGTYIILPFLNIIFIFFVEITQPQM
ncbi:MAG: type II secretion system F family protein [Candidatus Parvarchaeota archaeon]|nr:type II secretion system F family protein [Candidatus Jingweiarchaeum tengchongense]MCW1298460.1 type II secretion system F family protein [Candidatus Jingweiarchaeum tengchongense]MCW1300552.1 type II secretion system F family protein [Candidatus Jingweiarchaeum tengchongense]MCW1304973.1 type II secretion system F family protein [Candidatus Jingweiarchaeum tengchongense]MCW1309302.1 type II secretion system F family protein [Candidatus Jingweiarchaeum tengchongense]